MKVPAFVAVALGLGTLTHAHMEMKDPAPFRSKFNDNAKDGADYSMTSPLNADGSNFPCKGYHEDFGTDKGKPTAEWTPGQSYKMTITGSANHGGGSCQASFSFDKGKTWKAIHSYIGNCPQQGDSDYEFKVPSDTPGGDAIFAWSWFNQIGNREMYMNCAAVTIKGGSKRRSRIDRRAGSLGDRPDMFVANVGNGKCTVESTDLEFPDPGPDVDDKSQKKGPPSDCAGGGGGDSSGGGNSQGGSGGGDPASGSGQNGDGSQNGGGQAGGDPASGGNPTGDGNQNGGSQAGGGSDIGGSGDNNNGQDENGSQNPSAGGSQKPPGGVFVTVPATGSAPPTPTQTAGQGSPSSAAAPPPAATTSPTSQPSETSAPAAPSGVVSPPDGTTPSDGTPPSDGAPPSGTAPPSDGTPPSGSAPPSDGGANNGGGNSGTGGDAGAGSFAPGTPCESDGQWNCVSGSQFQRCASGAWSAMIPMSAGTSCAPGKSDTLTMG